MTDTGSYRVEQHPILGPLPHADTVEIICDGRALIARAGETVAAAMLANGIRQFRTTPESGRPRGYFCGVGRCPDCIVTVDGQLNVTACSTVVRDGMQVDTQHGLGTWTAS